MCSTLETQKCTRCQFVATSSTSKHRDIFAFYTNGQSTYCIRYPTESALMCPPNDDAHRCDACVFSAWMIIGEWDKPPMKSHRNNARVHMKIYPNTYEWVRRCAPSRRLIPRFGIMYESFPIVSVNIMCFANLVKLAHQRFACI